MIIHHAISMAKPVIASDDMMEDFKKKLVILRIPEDLLPLISPAGNMIDCAWKRYTQRASHKSTISLQCPDVKKIDLTPFIMTPFITRLIASLVEAVVRHPLCLWIFQGDRYSPQFELYTRSCDALVVLA